MMKVYDMVTYGLCASEQDAPALNFGTPDAARAALTEPTLQLIEITPSPEQASLHPSLRHMDVDSFLAALDV
jgi:hypothetical protein